MQSIFKIITVLLFTSLSLQSLAQDSTKASGSRHTKEYLISLSNLSPLNIGIGFKKSIDRNNFFRISLINLSASKTNSIPRPNTTFPTEMANFSAGMELGLECRKKLTDKFSLFHGPNVSFTYMLGLNRIKDPTVAYAQQKKTSQWHFTVSVPYSLGILFQLKGPFLMSAEIRPAFNYKYSKFEDSSETHNTSFGFSNQFGLISLIYRIPGYHAARGTPSF